MIKIENTEVVGWGPALRGMRNPKNSWDRADSHTCGSMTLECEDCPMVMHGHELAIECNGGEYGFCMGENDMHLAKTLAEGGAVHAKYRRMIVVYADITAPLYWWKEFDTYKVGTVASSCSTMHKIHAKEFTYDDFSMEHIGDVPNCDPGYSEVIDYVIGSLNEARHCYLDTKDKAYWWQMIQLLPSSYNQRRTVMMNYEMLANAYASRKDHKLDEWRTFCKWIENLSYSDLITGER